jgi:ribonuclease P protein component
MNRITRAADFRETVRRGRRSPTPYALVYLANRDPDAPTRFGFIVAKSVGNSVVRHQVTRRLRAIGFEVLPRVPVGRDVVIRALPGIPEVQWSTLHTDIARAIEKVGASS